MCERKCYLCTHTHVFLPYSRSSSSKNMCIDWDTEMLSTVYFCILGIRQGRTLLFPFCGLCAIWCWLLCSYCHLWQLCWSSLSSVTWLVGLNGVIWHLTCVRAPASWLLWMTEQFVSCLPIHRKTRLNTNNYKLIHLMQRQRWSTTL